MVNKTIFGRGQSASASSAPVADTINNAGGKAYQYSDKHALAQIACTNTFNGTFYADAQANYDLAKKAVDNLKGDPEFLAKVAVYARDKGYMKDMPSFLCVMLAALDKKLFRKVFRRVVDNGKMLRNVIQIARSGGAGKVYNMSSGTFRNAIQEWFDKRNGYSIFRASVGNDPSMRDILRMSRPKPNTPDKEALFGYLIGKDVSVDSLPQIVQEYEAYKKDKSLPVPNVDFRFLDSLGIPDSAWTEIARNAGWTMTRMNLNTFARHGVFKNAEVTKIVADRLKNREEIVKAKVFPYQLLQAFKSVGSDVPFIVKDALQSAMEISIENVPSFPGQVYVAVDVSGSMSGASVTGNRGSATSATRCIDVAGLFGAAVMRRNPSAEVIPFDTRVHTHYLNWRDSVMTNATDLAKFGGGGTDCGLAIAHLNAKQAKGDAIIFVSDNESWVDGGYRGQATKMMAEWSKFVARNPKAKLVCIDLSPIDNSQVKSEKPNILQVGGFSDQVFEVVNSFLKHGHESDHWVSIIEAIDLDAAPEKV